MKSKPLLEFWDFSSKKRPIGNIERDKRQKEVAEAKVDIMEASLEPKNSSVQHRHFLKCAQHKLDIGAIEPHFIRELMRLAMQGQEPSKLLDELLQHSSNGNPTAEH